MKKKILLGFIIGLLLFALSCLIAKDVGCGPDYCTSSACGVCITPKEKGFPFAVTRQQNANVSFGEPYIELLPKGIFYNLIIYQITGMLVSQGLYMAKWGKHK